MNKLVLVRGLPGSGKSTYAAKFADEQGFVHIETDQFFIKDGVYRFDYDSLGLNHRKCIDLARLLLQSNHSVVVANTFTTESEVAPYRRLAEHRGAALEIKTMTGDYGSVHNVPADAIERMKSRWEEIEETKNEL